MANGMTTSTQVPAAISNYYDGVLLMRATPFLCHDKFGQQRPVKIKSGWKPKFRRYGSLDAITQPLVEGITPTPVQLSKTEVEGTLEQYGTYTEITDFADETTEDPLLTETAEVLGENAGESIDLVFRDKLVAGTSVFWANTVAGRTDIVAGQSESDYKKIERSMMSSKAKMWRGELVPGSDKVGSRGISSSYYAIIDEYAYLDLRALTNFQLRADYPDGGASAMDGEIGALGHIRFIMTTNAKTYVAGGGDVGSTGLQSDGSSKVDVHTALIFGKNAYGICPLAGKALQMINKGFGEGNDPLNQRQTSAWKATTELVILNETFMYRYEFGVTA